MNVNNLCHPVTLANIHAAMRWASRASRDSEYPVDSSSGRFNVWSQGNGRAVCLIRNKKGKVFLAVEHIRNSSQAFGFYDNKGREITDVVLSVIRSN